MIRPAAPADAAALGELHNRTWWHAYQDIIEPAALAERVASDKTEHWAAAIADPDHDLAVYDLDGRIAAVVGVCSARMGEGEGIGELSTLYVEPVAQGAGLGGTLHDHGLDVLRARGFASAVLWTFRDNGQARDFYARRGWRLEPGSEALAPSTWLAPSIRLRREL